MKAISYMLHITSQILTIILELWPPSYLWTNDNNPATLFLAENRTIVKKAHAFYTINGMKDLHKIDKNSTGAKQLPSLSHQLSDYSWAHLNIWDLATEGSPINKTLMSLKCKKKDFVTHLSIQQLHNMRGRPYPK